jgi:hypothetical protein
MGIASIVTSEVPESTGVAGDEELPHPAAIAPTKAEAAEKPRKSRIARMDQALLMRGSKIRAAQLRAQPLAGEGRREEQAGGRRAAT